MKDGYMNKVYRKMVAYDPTSNRVSYVHLLTYEQAIDDAESDDAFYDTYEHANHQREMIIGITIGGSLLQLAPSGYGTYIQETENTMRFVNKSRFLCALSDYHMKNGIPFDIFNNE